MTYKQPPRSEADGPMATSRKHGDPSIVTLTVTHGGTEQSLTCTEHNASRLLAGLAMLLGVRLNMQDAKGIKL